MDVLLKNTPLVKLHPGPECEFFIFSLVKILISRFFTVVCANDKIVSSRFVKFSEDDMKSFSEEQKNVNTKKITPCDLKLFSDVLASEEDRTEIEEIPVTELQALAIKFLPVVRKKNSEEYEPSTLRAFS